MQRLYGAINLEQVIDILLYKICSDMEIAFISSGGCTTNQLERRRRPGENN